MTRFTSVLLLATAFFLSACVDPLLNERKLFIELNATQDTVFPGSQITIEATVTDQFNETAVADLTWTSNLPDAEVLENQGNTVTFQVPGNVTDTSSFSVTIVASTLDASSSATLNIDIGAEPFVILDAKTANNEDSYWLLGVHSAKRINIKDNDPMASDNRLVGASPDGQYIFVSRLLKNGDHLHTLFNTQTHSHSSLLNIEPSTVIDSVFWSPDSQHFILLASNELFSIEIPESIESSVAAERLSGSFDRVVWNDSAAANPMPLAALVSDSQVVILYTDSHEPIETDVSFVSIQVDSLTWELDRLLLLANTPSLTSQQLYSVNPSVIDGANRVKTNRLTGGSGPTNAVSVVHYHATAVTDFTYIERTEGTPPTFKIIDVKGGTATELDPSLNSEEIENAKLRWSPDATTLAVVTPTTNQLSIIDDRLGELSLLELETENIREYSDLLWLGEPATLFITSSVAEQNSIITVDLMTPTTFSEVFSARFMQAAAFIPSQTLVNAMASRFQPRILSPVGTDTGEHNNLSVFDIENKEWSSLISLQNTLLKPISPGNFTQTMGYPEDEVYGIHEGVVELSDGTVVVAVLASNGNIVDIIATHISGESVMPRSLIEDIAQYDVIRGIVGP